MGVVLDTIECVVDFDCFPCDHEHTSDDAIVVARRAIELPDGAKACWWEATQTRINPPYFRVRVRYLKG